MLDNNIGVFVDGEHISQRVWTYLGPRARSERGEWMLAAVGMAFKALKAIVPDHLRYNEAELVESDLVYRMVELLAGDPDHEVPFDLDAPFLFHRLMDRVHFAGTRSGRRSTAPNHDAEWNLFEAYETDRAPDSFRLPRLQLGDPLIILAELVRDGDLTRLDAALLARTALCGQSRAEAIAAVRETLPGDVGERTDEALRGRLEQARARLRKIYHRKFEIPPDRAETSQPSHRSGTGKGGRSPAA